MGADSPLRLPLIITRTPYRMSFFGGGSDNREWYERNGGCILTSSLNKYCYLSARRLPPFFDYKHRIVWSKLETVNSAEEIEHPAIRACLKYAGINYGVEIHHDGDLPARSGLGSSSAFTVGLLHALHGLESESRSRRALAVEAIEVEQVILKEAVGIQDQIECAHGGLNMITIGTDGSWYVEPVVLPKARLEEFQNHIMLFYTGQTRFSSQISAATVAAIASGVKDPELHKLAGMAREAHDILTSGASLKPLGQMLDLSWQIKRRMSPAVTTERIDEMYWAARHAGALGGKLLGAGGGGFMMLMVEPDDQARVRAALANFLEIPFAFDFTGTQTIFVNGG